MQSLLTSDDNGRCEAVARNILEGNILKISLHSKQIFCRFFVSDVISGGILGHLGPLCLALGANRNVVVFRWSFY